MILWRPYTQMLSAQPPTPLLSAQGSYLYTKEGRALFDGISSWWLITHGHGHKEIAEAIAQQSKKLEQVVFANFTHEPAEELAELLGSFLPRQLNSLFLSDNGSTAVEVAMKMAYQFAAQTGKPQRTKFISFTHSYHGDTCGAMSVSGDSSFTKPYNGMRFEILRAEQGRSIQDPLSVWVSSFEKMMESKGSEIVAVLLEPLLQGAGGMIVWPIEAVQKIYDISKKHGAFVIFDEVMTGFGRTGSMFAFEQTHRIPDFLCLSKGITGGFLPLGATVTTHDIYSAFLSPHIDKMLFHGHSYTGNALSCAAACANLKLFRKMNLTQQLSALTTAHTIALQKLSEYHSLKEVRVCGTIGVLELPQVSYYGNSFSATIQREALKLNLFIRPLGNTIYLMPPYSTTPEEIAWAWAQVDNVLLPE